ncbi:PhzF family phenazine biosynthesis protein [Streptomyces sp. NPDC005931]|uniref:PhzF family phenazine biosynthesis protein n=1 Tax=Streptomyces sp. NPDC005931 TaxID=3364737 RepID=UPI003675C536
MEILRYAAFTAVPEGGNPAGVVLDARGVGEAEMLAVAAEVGYSETAFLVPPEGATGEFGVRYFSPLAEVSFCGHATIATAVAYAERHGVGEMRLRTQAGAVTVTTRAEDKGAVTATLVSVAPQTKPLADDVLDELLGALRWSRGDMDPALPPRVAYAGAWHPIVGVSDRGRLAGLDYDFDGLAALMAREGWTTVDLVHREAPTVFHARNPFPPGGVVEDPATGAAAAAFGGYLRELGLVQAPAEVTVYQGYDMGRPSTIVVSVAAEPGSGIGVSGGAVPISS